MDEDLNRLTERWILAFCEAPPILDAELMRQVLDEMTDPPEPPA
jgi:hypothetical protein